ncbi:MULTISPECIES: hypothetical protein [Leucobacter]|uniref:hypothetical protein n=1 Tax=Leucobacter TaxID=55968 RepID=UPI000A4BC330|nr:MULTISPECIES: hypothetical protein [Leucobacter]
MTDSSPRRQFFSEATSARISARMAAVIVAILLLPVMVCSAPVLLGSEAAYGAPPGQVSALSEDSEGGLVSTRVCGQPSAEFLNFTKQSKTHTAQKNVIVSVEFVGADVAEIYLNGSRILLGEGLGGKAQAYSVDVDLLIGENIVRLLGTETCSTDSGEKGLFAVTETSIIYEPEISTVDEPDSGSDPPNIPILSVTGTGIDFLLGVLIGVVLSLLGLIAFRKAKSRVSKEPTEHRPQL